MIPFFPFILAGGAAIAAGAFLSSKSDDEWTVRETIPESEVPVAIRERAKLNGTQDPFAVRRISTDEVPADIRRQARKDKRR